MGDEQEAPARILIVDDHEDNVELLRARLESWGYATEAAMDGGQALEKVEAEPPDLILLDVMMPHIDGMEVARRVKSNTNLPFIPIIMQTALDTTEDKVEGLEAGADDYITKPIEFPELKARLRSMLRIKRLQEELEERERQLLDRIALDLQGEAVGRGRQGDGLGPHLHCLRLARRPHHGELRRDAGVVQLAVQVVDHIAHAAGQGGVHLRQVEVDLGGCAALHHRGGELHGPLEGGDLAVDGPGVDRAGGVDVGLGLGPDGGLLIKGMLFQVDASARQQLVREFFLT